MAGNRGLQILKTSGGTENYVANPAAGNDFKQFCNLGHIAAQHRHPILG
ncbi:hypothetical protein [Novosphingobium capsulatum]|nr:hypothetical protein [Novosphingobium capsulatum]WQD92148.1 hypothetical protein U0041_14280 [Novosphingobium capsulatum]